MLVSIELKLKEENKKLKEFMDKDFSQLFSDEKQFMMLKSRQIGKSSINALMEWHSLHSKYERARLRKERIKSIFNI
jgi:hypothetical protein